MHRTHLVALGAGAVGVLVAVRLARARGRARAVACSWPPARSPRPPKEGCLRDPPKKCAPSLGRLSCGYSFF